MVCVSPGASAVFSLFFYAKENSDPEVLGLLFGVSANHAEWKSVHSLSSASSLFSDLEVCTVLFLSPSYLAALRSLFGIWVYITGAMLGPTMDTYSASSRHGAVLGLVVNMSVGVHRQGFGQTVEKTGSAVAVLR